MVKSGIVIYYYPCSLLIREPKRPKGGTTSMNKYELALVVNAKIEDDARAAVVEKAKGYIARYNGNVTEVEEWGKKRLAYEIQKMREGYYYFIQFVHVRTQPDFHHIMPGRHFDSLVSYVRNNQHLLSGEGWLKTKLSIQI